MTYAETLHYLYHALPDFQRAGASAYKPGLETARALDLQDGHPHESYASVHIAGTNGKGSVSHMLASVMQSAGYCTGLFTSPHLRDFRERIRVNGVAIPEAAVLEYVHQRIGLFEQLHASFFEMTSAMALHWFARCGVDIAIMETGLGGRLDSTNIISPILSVITNISLDHTALLGHTLGEIANEKAGIIKPGVPVVVGESHPQTNEVFTKYARDNHAQIVFADERYQVAAQHCANGLQHFRITHRTQTCGMPKAPTEAEARTLATDLSGLYQQKNILTVHAALEFMQQSGWTIPENAVREGLANVCRNTCLMGRWQTIGTSPLIVCDTAHNPAGIEWTVQQMLLTPHQHLHIVLGMVRDKDITSILKLLPKQALYYFTQADSPRSLPAEILHQMGTEHGLRGSVHTTVHGALQAARSAATKDDFIYVGGSTFVVAEVL